MCGLFGYVLKQPIKNLGRFLGTRNDKRGGSGWGMLVFRGNKPMVIKGPGDFGKNCQSIINPDTILMGHTRIPTTGKVCLDNNHPFEIGAIIGSHNGMVYNHSEMNKKFNRNFAVDSMHIFAHLDKDLPLDEFEGYGTISWYDYRDEQIRLCRLRNGELSVRKLYSGKETVGVAWSSTATDLKWVVDRMKGITKSEAYHLEEGEVYLAEQDGLYRETDRTLKLSSRSSWDASSMSDEDWEEAMQQWTAGKSKSEDLQKKAWLCEGATD